MPNYEELSLEALFAAADRMGNKYLSLEEQKDFLQQLSQCIDEFRKEIAAPQSEISLPLEPTTQISQNRVSSEEEKG